MNKSKNGIIRIGIITILLISILGTTALATTYTSSLSLSYRSSLTGATRSYVGSSHKIAMKLSSRELNEGDNYCEVTLQKKSSYFSYTDEGTVSVNLKTIGVNYSATYPGKPDGDYRYSFDNYFITSDTRKVDQFTCDTVTMSSY